MIGPFNVVINAESWDMRARIPEPDPSILRSTDLFEEVHEPLIPLFIVKS